MGEGSATPILEVSFCENGWTPPAIDEAKYAEKAKGIMNAGQSDRVFFIIQTEPFIDSIYIEYNSLGNLRDVRRFVFNKGYCWDSDDEIFFVKHCIKKDSCAYNGGLLDEIYEKYSSKYPDWNLKRYYSKGLRILDHIYNCMKQNTAKELLYKAGLDELAVRIDELDELNLLATKPSELYDNVPIRVLRSVNCPYGALMMADHEVRQFLRKMNTKFPTLFGKVFNNAQCRYLESLIKGDLTVGEAGRLFSSRRADLEWIRTSSSFELFMSKERRTNDVRNSLGFLKSIDPIYEQYIRKLKAPEEDPLLSRLVYYLLNNREAYDKAIKRSNRQREYSWMERGDLYFVRYPQTISDFLREAVYMQNCLPAYLYALIENDTTILFMRKSNDINKPFITIEVYGGELIQAYHRFNENCTKEEAGWIKAYCRRHGIGTGKFSFGEEQDELF